MNDKIAVIGVGMMGGAIVKSLLKSGYSGKITAIDIKTEKLKELCRKYLNTKKDVLGGDENTSKGILLPIKELL